MKKRKILALMVMTVVVFSLMLSGCGADNSEKVEDSDEQDEVEMVMPEDLGTTTDLNKFATIDIYGNSIGHEVLNDYEYTVIDVWGTFCDPCIRAMPELQELYEKYQDKGVNVLGIVVDVQNADRSPQMEAIKNARAIVEAQGAEFTSMLIPKNLLYSVLSDIKFIPTQFLVDSDGNIVSEMYTGGKNLDQWSEIIDKKLSELKKLEK